MRAFFRSCRAHCHQYDGSGDLLGKPRAGDSQFALLLVPPGRFEPDRVFCDFCAYLELIEQKKKMISNVLLPPLRHSNIQRSSIRSFDSFCRYPRATGGVLSWKAQEEPQNLVPLSSPILLQITTLALLPSKGPIRTTQYCTCSQPESSC